MKAYIFPGQGSQFCGLGKDIYENSTAAKKLFTHANEILGFSITDVMFEGTSQALKQTKITQPAVFLHSVILALTDATFQPNMVAGHSLGEFSALVASGALSFEDGLQLVARRAMAMQKACEHTPSTMAAIVGLADEKVVEICSQVTDEIVVPANYNMPGQLVISGSVSGVQKACVLLKAAGARRAISLPVGGAFHSPLMAAAKEELATAIQMTTFQQPNCPIYQNVDGKPYTNPAIIKKNLVEQLTAPILWTQTVRAMVNAGATHFIESGPGKVLQGLVKKIHRQAIVTSIAQR